MVSGNEAQRARVWLIALARTKLVKENEPIGKSARIFRVHTNLAIGYTRCWRVVFYLIIILFPS